MRDASGHLFFCYDLIHAILQSLYSAMAQNRKIKQIRHFLEIEIWKVKSSSLPKSQAWFYRQIRIWLIAFSEFKKDNISEKASALTYFTVLSIVPVIAMAFGIAKGFGLEEYLVAELHRLFTGNEAILDQVLLWSARMLESVDGGIISGISFVFLVYAVLRLLHNIEISFNAIWDTKSRTWQRKLSDYLAIIMLGPIFVILSSSATVFVTTFIQDITSNIELLSAVRPAIVFGLKFTPYMIMWGLLIILYIIFPNTRVKLGPAIWAGILAGTMFQLTQLAWINGQVYLSRYNAIYGVFAILPLFMIYLQTSWLIVLFGAEFAFATQNADNWEYRHVGMQMSPNHRKKVTLLILRHIVKNFELGNNPLSLSELSSIIQIPYRFILNICRELEDVGILNRVHSEEHERFQPAIGIGRIDIFSVLRKLDYKGFDELKTNEDVVYSEIEELLSEIESITKKSKANKLLSEI